MNLRKPAALLLVLLGLWMITSLAIAQTNSTNQTKKPEANRGTPSAVASSEGEKRFQTNCGRCHNPPENISPSEARAVVRHMRVRAMLTTEDEKLILEFLAP